MTTRAAPKVKPFAERMKRMEGASVTPISAIKGRTVYRVQAVGSKDAHDIPVILEGRTPIVGDCDCDAYHYLRDPEGCVHTSYLKRWLQENNTLTTTELTRTNGAMAQVDLPSDEVMELVIGSGDIGRLTSRQRVEYILKLCESLGLNPMSQPFAFITFQGKIVPYVRKDATDQLRKIHNVNIQIVDKQMQDGIYIVTARATMPNGRSDESTGALSMDRLTGDAKANQIMKCETKAKRRVTLSICGLGFLDESELSTMTGQQPVQFNQTTGDIDVPAQRPVNRVAEAEATSGNSVSERWEATKARIISKRGNMPAEVWANYFKVNIGKWANKSQADLDRIECDVDNLVFDHLQHPDADATAAVQSAEVVNASNDTPDDDGVAQNANEEDNSDPFA